MLRIHTSNLSLLAVRPIAFQCLDQNFEAISSDEQALVQRILPLAQVLISFLVRGEASQSSVQKVGTDLEAPRSGLL